MSNQNLFEVSLKTPLCIEGLSEDALRQFVDALQVAYADKQFTSVVLATSGVQVKFNFGSDGNFQGVTAKINGQQVVLIPGTNSKALGVFAGSPSPTNPGPGWEVNATLTQQYLNQPPDQNQWEIFYAQRVNVLNSVT